MHIECPSCGSKLKAPEHLAGKKARCRCGNAVFVPPPAAPSTGTECTSCGMLLPPDAVLCTNCGFNLQTGEYIGVQLEQSPAPAPRPSGPRTATPRSRGPAPRRKPSAIGQFITALIKPALLVVILGALGWLIWVCIQGLSYDPAKVQRETMAKLTPGKTVDEVIRIAGKPAQSFRYVMFFNNLMPVELEYRGDFLAAYRDDIDENGFGFLYTFTAGGRFEVAFDREGRLTGVAQHNGLLEVAKP